MTNTQKQQNTIIKQNTIQFKNKLYILLFTYILSISIVIFNLFVRHGLETDYLELFNILGFSFFFFNLFLVKDIFKRAEKILEFHYLIPIVFFKIIIFSLLFPDFINNIIFYILSFIGYISAFYILYLIFKNLKILSIFLLSLIGFSFVIGIIYYTYSSWSHTPLFFENLSLGFFGVDLDFHIALAQMLKTYNIGSTGLDGLADIHYHYGSHYLFARLSIFSGLSIEKIYNFVYPILFIPLYFNILFHSVLQLCKYKQKNFSLNPNNKLGYLFWSLFILLHASYFFCNNTSEFIYNDTQELFSESYNLGLIFAFFILCIFLDYLKYKRFYLKFIIALLIGLSFYIKISIPLLIIPAFIYLYFRNKQLFKLKNILFTIICFSIYFIIYKSVSGYNITKFSLFDFFINYIHKDIWFLLLPFYLLWTILYIVLKINYIKKSNKLSIKELIKNNKLIEIEIIILITFISLLPGAFLYIASGSARFFSDVPRKVIIILLLALIPYIKIITNKYYIFSKISLLIIFSFSIFCSFYFLITQTNILQIKPKNDFIKQLQNSPKIKKRYEYFKQLSQLDKLPIEEKRKLLIHLPYNIDSPIYSDLYNCSPKCLEKGENNTWCLSFIPPALTGIASINGLPPNIILKNYKSYGFNAYQKRKINMRSGDSLPELKERAKLLGLEDKKIKQLSLKSLE